MPDDDTTEHCPVLVLRPAACFCIALLPAGHNVRVHHQYIRRPYTQQTPNAGRPAIRIPCSIGIPPSTRIGLLWQPRIPQGSRPFPWANQARASLPRAKIMHHLAAHEVEECGPLPCILLGEQIHDPFVRESFPVHSRAARLLPLATPPPLAQAPPRLAQAPPRLAQAPPPVSIRESFTSSRIRPIIPTPRHPIASAPAPRLLRAGARLPDASAISSIR